MTLGRTGWESRPLDGLEKRARPKPCRFCYQVLTVLRAFDYFQIVLHAEDAEYLIRPNAGDLLVHCAGDGAVEAQLAVVHHDADG